MKVLSLVTFIETIKDFVYATDVNVKVIILTLLVVQGSGGGRVVKLLACGERGPGFDSPPRHLNFRDCLSPASKSRYG